MNEEHMIKCSSCGKLFTSKKDETLSVMSIPKNLRI